MQDFTTFNTILGTFGKGCTHLGVFPFEYKKNHIEKEKEKMDTQIFKWKNKKRIANCECGHIKIDSEGHWGKQET